MAEPDLDFDEAPPVVTPPPPRKRREPPREPEPEHYDPEADAHAAFQDAPPPEPQQQAAVVPFRRTQSAAPAGAIGRMMPHSIEAEEYLLSSCLLDAADVLPRCELAGITGASFYVPAHGVIFDMMMDMRRRRLPSIDASTLAEELKTAKRLDEVGGYALLAQVGSRIPTTAQAGYFIEKVRETALLRTLIEAGTATVEDAYNYSGDLTEHFASIRARFDRIERGITATGEVQSLTSFGLPAEDDPAALIGRNRYIGRGDGAVIVSSSGMGKSVMAYEWPVLAALGRPFLGIVTKRPLRSLIIQAEDADGDIGEVMFSLEHTLALTSEEKRTIANSVFVVRDKVHRGPAFIAQLRGLVGKVKPDLVWINPLHAYAGCDIADAAELGAFLRGGLNGINHNDQFAYMIVHHTPKPITGKGAGDKKWNEFMYDAAGSAELVNWARAVLTLKPTETEGHFHLILAKRGRRAGAMIPAADSETGMHMEITTKIPIRHSSEKITIPGRKEPFHVLHWEMRAADPQENAEKPKMGRPPKYFFKDYVSALRQVCSGYARRQGFNVLHRAAHSVDGVSTAQFRTLLRAASESGEIRFADGKYFFETPGESVRAES